MLKKNIKPGLIIGLLVSAFSLFWIYKQFDVTKIIPILKSTTPITLFPLPILILASFCVRAQRWRLLVNLNTHVSFWSAFSAQMIGYLFNNILPARAGDILRGIELAKSARLSKAQVLTSLIVERIFELTFVVLVLGLVLLNYPKLPIWLKSSGYIVSALSLCGLAFLTFLHTRGRRALKNIILWLNNYLSLKNTQRLSSLISSILDSIEHSFTFNRTLHFFILTCFVWIIEVLIVFTVATAIHLPLPLGNALFVLLILAIGLMIPSSPGFVGTYEFFGISALSLIGIQGETALSFILMLHIISLVGSTLLGITCIIFRHKKIRK